MASTAEIPVIDSRTSIIHIIIINLFSAQSILLMVIAFIVEQLKVLVIFVKFEWNKSHFKERKVLNFTV